MKLIVKHPAAVLHERAAEVPVEAISSPKIQSIINEMSEALRKTPDGIGIAAPQIGYPLRIFLASEEALRWDETDQHEPEDRKKKKWEYYVFINPVIIKTSRRKIIEAEGCLSVPGVYGRVERAEKVSIEAYNEKGEKFTRGTSKLYARVMQHEVDHLEGVLFIERAKTLMRPKKVQDNPVKEVQ